MFKKTRVLVIDSDENILWAFKNFLLKNKIKMTGITNHEEAVNKLCEGDYDLILTDIRSDVDLEIQFIQQVKQIKKNTPIIALTSYPDIINSNMLKPFGIDYLFIKPLDLAVLESAILKYLNKSIGKQTKNIQLTKK
jgi:DNA-binding NtrC family response regulator